MTTSNNLTWSASLSQNPAGGQYQSLAGNARDEEQGAEDPEAKPPERYRKKHGIPMPLHPAFRLPLCMRWLVILAILFYLLFTIIGMVTHQVSYPLGDAEVLRLQMKNCDVYTLRAGEHPWHSKDRGNDAPAWMTAIGSVLGRLQASEGPAHHSGAIVTLQHWKFLGTSHWDDNLDDGKTRKLSVNMRMRLAMFRCLATIQVPDDKQLKEVNAVLAGQDLSRVVLSASPAKSLDFSLNEGFFEAQYLPEKLSVQQTSGKIVMRPRSVSSKHEVKIKSKHALVAVESAVPMTVQLEGKAKESSILEAPVIGDSGDKVVLGDGTSNLEVSLNMLADSPSYFRMDKGSGKLKRRQGTDQELDTIKLTAASKETMEDVAAWIKEHGSASAPWVARIRVMTEGQGKGLWQALSSEAFLSMPLQAFILLSAGSLHPSISDSTIQMLSIPDAPDDDPDVEDLDNPRLWAAFHLLEPYLNASPGKTIAWVPDGGRPIVFTKQGIKWRNHYIEFLKKQSFMFRLALILNAVASAGAACALILLIKRKLKTMFVFSSKDINISTTHRCATRHRENTTWRVQATQVDYPEHAVVLRWRKQTGIHNAPFFQILAESAGKTDEIQVDEIKAELVPTLREHSVQLEWMFHIGDWPGTLLEPKHRAFSYHLSYFFKIKGWDNNEEMIAESDWSNEVHITPRLSVFMFPFLVLKAFFPVPTSSLGFFVDNYAKKKIGGQIPQQLVVLDRICIKFHKNFREFPEPDSEFFVVAFMGEDQGAEAARTEGGSCITWARTHKFEAPAEVLIDDSEAAGRGDPTEGEDTEKEEKKFNLELYGDDAPGGIDAKLMLGGADRKYNAVDFHLIFDSDKDSAAIGKIDWEDLMEEYEETEKTEDNRTICVDVKAGQDYQAKGYEEDYVVQVRARVDFKNSVDAKCKSLDEREVFFQKDSPGQIFYHGMERFVNWDEQSDLMKAHDYFMLYAVYPDYPNLWMGAEFGTKKVSDFVSKKSVGVSFLVDFPEEIPKTSWDGTPINSCVCELNVRSREGPVEGVCSHRFIVCRTWTLAEMELMYAAFCKMNNMEMENLDDEALKSVGISKAEVPLKVVPRLRRPFEFEREETCPLIECPGMCIISNQQITSVVQQDDEPLQRGSSSGNLDDHASAGGSDSAFTKKSDKSKDQSKEGQDEEVFLPTLQKVSIIENMWPHYWWQIPTPCGSFTISCGYGTSWAPSFLLMYCFYPVDNMINVLTDLADMTQILPKMYNAMQAIVGERFMHSLFVFPLQWGFPFIAEMVLFMLQMFVFMVLPALLLFVAVVYEYLTSSLQSSFEVASDIDALNSHIPDFVFSRSISHHDIGDWWNGLSQISVFALTVGGLTAGLMVLLIFEANFCRNLLASVSDAYTQLQSNCKLCKVPLLPPPLMSVGHVYMFFNKCGIAILSFYGWMLFAFITMIVLWFVMAVVIYPEQMLTALAAVAGVGIMLYTMLSKDRLAHEQIRAFLRDELPDILDVICTNFIEDFDKKQASIIMDLEAKRVKINKSFWEKMQGYLRKRLHEAGESDLGDSQKRFESVVKVEDPSAFVHHVFDHALMKEKKWKDFADAAQKAEKMITAATSRGAEPPSITEAIKGLDIKNTDAVLANLGLSQSDTSHETHFELRQRLMDRETESGGDASHLYPKELKEKLTCVFVRQLELNALPPEVHDIFTWSGKFADAMFNAHAAKLTLFDRRTVKASEKSLLQLLIQETQLQKMRKVFVSMAEDLDQRIDPQTISEKLNPFIESTMPDEINKQLRLTLDEHCIGSAKQRLFERARRWKSGIAKEWHLKKHLTLCRYQQSISTEVGLFQSMTKIGLIDQHANHAYKQRFHDLLERMVREWKKDDSHDYRVDSADFEDFIRDMTGRRESKQFLWWDAMRELLKKIGFPVFFVDPDENGSLNRDAFMAGDPDNNLVSEQSVMREFEKQAMKKGGLLPNTHVIEFLQKFSGADKQDSVTGRIWKAQMVALLQEIQICGYADTEWEKKIGSMKEPEKWSNTTLVEWLRSIGVKRTQKISDEGITGAEFFKMGDDIGFFEIEEADKNKINKGLAEIRKELEKADEEEEGAAGKGLGVGKYNLPVFAQYKWPPWMEDLWNDADEGAAPWPPKHSSLQEQSMIKSKSLRPFLEKSKIQSFIRNLVFSNGKQGDDRKQPSNVDAQKDIVSEEYNNWFVTDSAKGPLQMWNVQKKSWLKLRCIWHEVFWEVLRKMDNEIEDEEQKIQRFGLATKEMQATTMSGMRSSVGGSELPVRVNSSARNAGNGSECDGFLDLGNFYTWLDEKIVKGEKEVSRMVFREVLKNANMPIQNVITDALWIASDKTMPGHECTHGSVAFVSDLEDRVVMFLSKGLGIESVRSLIFDEMQVPVLQNMGEESIKKAFTRVDDKTGKCGFLEPHEIQQMIRLLVNKGMSLKMLSDTITALSINMEPEVVKSAFMMMDTNGDDVIDVPEFLGLIDLLIDKLVPEMIFSRLNMQPKQIALKLIVMLMGAVTIFLFIAISLGAFQVEVGKGAAGTGASLARAGIAILAVLGLRRDAGDDDQERMFVQAKIHLYQIMGVSPSQMEAKKRAQIGGSSGGGQAAQLMAGKRELQRSAKAFKGKGPKGGGHGHGHDDDDDDDDDD